MPSIVDRVYVVDDGSTDQTSEVAAEHRIEGRSVEIIRHEAARGVGGAIASGYARALSDGFDVAVVMAGDAQMDPRDFVHVIYPVAAGLADYCKGNRFLYQGGLAKIPFIRKFGNFVLSSTTKLVSGYWHISDSQCGYTAINRAALRRIDVEGIYPSYGCPNDILVKLNIARMRVAEVPVNPVYDGGEVSKMRIPRIVTPILMLLTRAFFRRVFVSFVIAGGHPLVFAYLFAAFFLLSAVGLGTYIAVQLVLTGLIMKAALIAGGAAFIVGVQLLLTALGMDLEANRHLNVHLNAETLDELGAIAGVEHEAQE